MEYQDRLYGKIEIEEPVRELLECGRIQRLNRVSLSAVPDIFLVPRHFSGMASRLEHSIGMAHLAGILCNFRKEFAEYRNALLLSAICHDAGAPPFSHNSEHLLEELTGLNHEQYIEHILKNSAAEETIKKYGYSLRNIAEIVGGKSGVPGKLMNNSLDIDNMDNTERYGFSSGKVGRISNPEGLVKAFMLKNGIIRLDKKYSGEIEKWKVCRSRVYDEIVYGDINISAGSMLRLALEFAYESKGKELLKDGFFMLDDGNALDYLEESCHDARIIIERARKGMFYKKTAQISSFNPSKKMAELCSKWKGGLEISDYVSEKFGLQRSDVCAQAFRHKPERDLGNLIPEEKQGGAEKAGVFDVRVFINPELKVGEKKVRDAVSDFVEMQ